ncbi:MAG: Holliday junction branch migration protein RuvA [Candidatus Sumerlaeaceae bacterium]|nr:Holliday junction branch migration protein RuvA [Candidatus Sumerlaeaceae bacterium]
MIEYLRGILRENDGEHIVVDVHGVGYGLDVPASTAAELPPVGEEVALYTHLEVRENDLSLYGFAKPEEREVFAIVVGVSGIGPRTALAVLSCLRIADFAAAVVNSEIEQLTRIPGIGKKTAERLVMELRDKMKRLLTAHAKAGYESPVSTGTTKEAALAAEVSAALQALGCKPAVADRAAQRALELLGEKASLEDLVREALRHRY